MKTQAHTVSQRAAEADAGQSFPVVQPGAGSVFTKVSTMTGTGWLAIDIDQPAHDLTPALKELLTRTDHVQHWGINE